MQDYRIQLDTYSGPMDLLLYLIKRDEVDIYDIPIAAILDQYVAYVRMLGALDPEAVGDFLVMAATLMEIKSRMLLPRVLPIEGEDEEPIDPRADLVRQLLAYRTFREAAHELGRRAEVHAQRFPRPAIEPGNGEDHLDIEDAQIWDLLAAFNKLMTAVGAQRAVHEVKYDDTPLALHAVDIVDRLQREGPSILFDRIFEGRSRTEMIGLFLALLELIRQRRVRVEQADRFGPIIVHLLDATPIESPEDFERALVPAALAECEAEPTAMADADAARPAFTAPPLECESEPEEPDDFARRLDAITITEVDLGRSEESHDRPRVSDLARESPAPDEHPSGGR